jgi:hypothetical protein
MDDSGIPRSWDDLEVAVHPASTTFEGFDYLPGVEVRNGRLVNRL